MKISPGVLEEFKRHEAEYIKHVKEKDSGTLQGDWTLANHSAFTAFDPHLGHAISLCSNPHFMQ